jgi:chromate transporter
MRSSNDRQRGVASQPAASTPARPSSLSLASLLAISAAMIVLPTWLMHAGATAPHAGSGAAYSHTRLFLFFLKIGSVLYGSGYVLLAFLKGGLVEQFRWLTSAQLLDATAVGQVTPGPVFTTATFVGYLTGGPLGALLATVAIFLPSFVLVALSGPLIPRLRRSPLMSAFLDGVNVAALALMASVTWDLGRAAVVDWFTAALALASAVLLVRYKLNSAWLIAGAAALGIAASLLRPLVG